MRVAPLVLLLRLAVAEDAPSVAAEACSYPALSLLQLDARASKRKGRGSSFGDVVGERGTYVISAETSPRAAHTKAALLNAGVVTTAVPATDAALARPEALAEACIPSRQLTGSVHKNGMCHGLTKRPGGKFGDGCHSATEQAIASSHRNALLRAKARSANAPPWTAILEDDVVPVDPVTWNDNFRKAWQHVPSSAKVVRLGWCNLNGNISIDEYAKHNETEFVFVEDMILASGQRRGKYYTGGCTNAYMVHRDAIDEVLSIFPCCCPLDCCMERELFYWPHPRCRDSGSRECWGQQHLVNLDSKNVSAFSDGFTTFRQRGVLVQDNRFTKSSRSRQSSASSSLANADADGRGLQGKSDVWDIDDEDTDKTVDEEEFWVTLARSRAAVPPS